jgi:hypothetical protein
MIDRREELPSFFPKGDALVARFEPKSYMLKGQIHVIKVRK